MKRDIYWGLFVWNAHKEQINIRRHGVDFQTAKEAFHDPHRLIAPDEKHSLLEPRWFCVGAIRDRVVTVRFTVRHGRIRLIGAGYWRKGKILYEKKKMDRP